MDARMTSTPNLETTANAALSPGGSSLELACDNKYTPSELLRRYSVQHDLAVIVT